MSEWRDQIVRRLVPNTARVTAVSDADGLLRDPGVFKAIQAKGFAIVQFEDSVSFRFDYESRFRSKWDVGENSGLVVVFKPGEYEFDTLPADVLANAQRLSLSIKEIFPTLSYAVISQLETVYYDALYHAQQQAASAYYGRTQITSVTLSCNKINTIIVLFASDKPSHPKPDIAVKIRVQWVFGHVPRN